MISRVYRVGFALLVSLSAAAVCFADDPGVATGKGGMGGQLGMSSFALDRALGSEWFVDYSKGARARFAFDAHWRYQMSKRWRGQIATGFAWAGYSDERNTARVPKYPAPFVDPIYPSGKEGLCDGNNSAEVPFPFLTGVAPSFCILNEGFKSD